MEPHRSLQFLESQHLDAIIESRRRLIFADSQSIYLSLSRSQHRSHDSKKSFIFDPGLLWSGSLRQLELRRPGSDDELRV